MAVRVHGRLTKNAGKPKGIEREREERSMRRFVQALARAPRPVLPISELDAIKYYREVPVPGQKFHRDLLEEMLDAIGKCEVLTCGAGGPDAYLRLHHEVPRAEDGTSEPHNAELLCFQCHQGGHNTGGSSHSRRRHGRPKKNDCISAIGIPMQVSYALLHAYEQAGMVDVHREIRNVRATADAPIRPLIVANRVTGSYASEFFRLRDALQRAVRRAGVQGRLSPEAQSLIFRFALDHFVPKKLHDAFRRNLPLPTAGRCLPKTA